MNKLENKYIMIEDKHIEEYAIATIISEKHYGFKIKVDKKWFKAILKEVEETQGYRDQFSSTARIAKILNLPVNICVGREEDGYLLGIEPF
ncbi:MAG: hypothetical protein ACMZI0_00125 [Symbiopectobacterium sp.]|uniref:hypothetical protein n=1 Tax=Symbiopectobacterium sp. TaxID=2952789 RepID=UPI0039E7B8AE